MKHFLLFALFLTSTLTVYSQSKVKFFYGDINALRDKAKKEGKPYFIDFYADYCLPCQVMDESVFTDPRIISYVSDNYLAYKVDVNEFDGQSLKTEFGVKTLPTIIFFDARGQILFKQVNGVGNSAFLKLLQTYNKPGVPKKVVKNPNEENQPEKVDASFKVPKPTPPKPKPFFKEEESEAPTKPQLPKTIPSVPVIPKAIKSTPKEASVPTVKTPIDKPAPPKPVKQAAADKTELPTSFGDGLYEFSAKSHDGIGFSLQAGAYDNFVLCMKEVKRLKVLFPKTPILVYIKTDDMNGEPQTKHLILIGDFEDKAAAIQFQPKLEIRKIKNTVVNLNKFYP